MKTHTNNFKEQIKKFGRQIDSRITFGSTVLGKNDLNAVTPSYQGTILKSVMKQLDIDSNVAIPLGTVLKYEFGLKVNGEYEYINFGNYVVYSIEKQEDTNSYKITCYDKLLYSMLDYVKLPITYPISVRDYINAISTTLGLKFANKSGTFANYNKQIQTDLYDGLGYTFRDILDELAQVTASTICLNNNDELEIRYITETNDTIDEEFLKDVNVNFGEKFGAVNTIVLSRSAGSDNIYYPTVLPTNPYEIKISDNQIMNGNDRVDFLPDIYNKLNGLEFYTNDFVSTGIIYYDLCDRYSVKIGDNTYSCVMFNDEVLVTQGLEENIYTELPEQTKTDYKKADTTDRRINQAYAILDKQNKKFEVLVSEVDSNGEKIGSLEITTGNISTKVSSVEKNLSTTNTNLSNLSGKVDTLINDINGVSADFEDFKDNEYINTIQNIQDQLDGAIQFWSGTEVPTLNNFPANQWNTEALRNEHQGDIYDVLQGETIVNSYKFIKIDNEYQWRLVSDSEIAAVRQLAQEALEKANKNATEIGTIKTRVSSLEQTDEQIKASVESIDKQIIPTASVSGSNIYVEDASDNPLTYLEIDGKSTQEVRSGKNLLNNIANSKSNYYGVNYVVNNDKSILVNGTASSQHSLNLVNFTENIYGGKYLVGAPKGSSTSTYCLIVSYYDADRNWKKEEYDIGDGLLLNSNYPIIVIGILVRKDAVVNNQLFKPMIVDSLETEYEQYGVSPSPDYPSKIESVGYENLANYNIKQSSSNIVQSDVFSVLPNNTYTFSTTTRNTQVINYYKDIDKKDISNSGWRNTPYTFTTPENCYYIQQLIRKEDNSSITPSDLGDLSLFKSSIAHSYIPYGKYGVEVKTVGKNKFNEEQAKINSNYTANTGIGSSWYTITIDLLPNTEYTITRFANNVSTNSSFNLQFYLYEDISNPLFYVNNTIAETVLNKKTLTFTTRESGKIYLAHKYGNDERLTKLFNNIDIQIEEGKISTEYDKYKSNTSVIELDAPLRSLPNGVKDIAYIRNNKLYVDRYVGSVVLNGSENWVLNETGTGYSRYALTIENIATNINDQDVYVMSNYFLGANGDYVINGGANSDSICIASNKRLLVKTINSDITTLEKFKSLLSTHNTQVDYELATPYTEEIGEIQMPSTFKGVNHINTTDELEPTLNIEYVRDTKLSNYVEGQINKVMTIEERHYAELAIEDDNIKASVESVNSSLNGLNTTINRVEEITTDNSQVINVISTNIDKTSGEVREVTTTTGFTFNADGMTIDDGSGFKAQHRSDGTYYKDGESVVGQYTKDGSKQKDLELFGTYSYGKESIDDTPMFVGQLYTDANGERGFGHFYNGEG